MKYLHTMVRVSDLDESLDFYCNKLGLKEVRRRDVEAGRFTLVFLSTTGEEDACVELTEADCMGFAGTWLGAGSGCGPTSCASGCSGDLTGPGEMPDGNVDSLDFLELIAQWGVGGCPTS